MVKTVASLANAHFSKRTHLPNQQESVSKASGLLYDHWGNVKQLASLHVYGDPWRRKYSKAN